MTPREIAEALRQQANALALAAECLENDEPDYVAEIVADTVRELVTLGEHIT